MALKSIVIISRILFTCVVKKSGKAFKPLDEEAGLRLCGRRIKEIRKSAKYSQFNLAVEKDLNLRRLGAWEAGEDIKLSNIIRLCNALGITLKEFFSEGFE